MHLNSPTFGCALNGELALLHRMAIVDQSDAKVARRHVIAKAAEYRNNFVVRGNLYGHIITS
ncbi:MAG: hypothetical protein J0I69_11350 [Altererythrobacter sp.]|nr:hypothetical protein [Altererythrobacter sp.]OJU60536.1 MAG: hypothetical protein BGO08_10075 [Altererythrobacter sp. 66-12]